jgi:hypothetical protein
VFDSYINANINKMQWFAYRITTNVQHDICGNTTSSNKWDHVASNKWFEEMFGSHTRKAFSLLVFTVKEAHAWNMTRRMKSTAI